DMDMPARSRPEDFGDGIEIIYRVPPCEFVSASATARDEAVTAQEVAGPDRSAVFTGQRPIDIGIDLERIATIVKSHRVKVDMDDTGKEQSKAEQIVAMVDEVPFVARAGSDGGDRDGV